MNCKSVYIMEFTFVTIVLFITIIEPSAAIRTTHQCSPENPHCEYCDVSNKSLCVVCKNLTMCSDAGFSTLNSDDGYRKCLKGCPENSYEKLLEDYYKDSKRTIIKILPRFCCQPCFEGCFEGCTGNEKFIGDKGCNKCKYAVMLTSDHFQCLKSKSLDKNKVCIENNLTNYYAEPSKKKDITELECKKCSDNCKSCSSLGNDVDKNECRCASGFEVITEIQNGTEIRLCIPVRVSLIGTFTTNSILFISFLVFIFVVFVIWLLLMSVKCCNKNRSSNISAAHASLSDVPLIPSSKSTPKNFELPLLSSISSSRSTSISTPQTAQTIVETTENAFFPDDGTLSETTPSAFATFNTLIIIKKDELKFGKRLGAGFFADVFKGKYNGQDVAIKKIKELDIIAIQETIDEAKFMAENKHKHIQKLIGLCQSEGVMIVSELRIGSLKEFLQQNRKILSKRNLLIYCKQIAEAVEFLHSMDKIHIDLSAKNVLVKNINHVEVGDFGLPKVFKQGEKARYTRCGKTSPRWLAPECLNVLIRDINHGEVGDFDLAKVLKQGEKGYTSSGKTSPRWLAPECLKSKFFDKPNDVWAFGVTCWEIFTFGMKTPYEHRIFDPNNHKDLLKNLNEHRVELEYGLRLPQPTEIDVYAIMLKCWTDTVELRIHIQQARQEFEQLINELPLLSPKISERYF